MFPDCKISDIVMSTIYSYSFISLILKFFLISFCHKKIANQTKHMPHQQSDDVRISIAAARAGNHEVHYSH